jgi:hypothetical protein
MVAFLIWILKSDYAILGSITSRDVKRASLLFLFSQCVIYNDCKKEVLFLHKTNCSLDLIK